MIKLTLDPNSSQIRVRAFAEGLLSRLAHDIELSCRDLSGNAERMDSARGVARVQVPIGSIEVNGTLDRGRVDKTALSVSERNEILGKMQKSVFHVAPNSRASVSADARLEGENAQIRITLPNGRVVERNVAVEIHDSADPGAKTGGTIKVTGRFELSLREIGSAPVKGPMNAFRVKDDVVVLFELSFVENEDR